MADVDFDFDLDPSPAADGTTSPVLNAPVAPESSAHQEAAVLAPAVIVLPAPPVPPAAAATEGGQTPPVAISVDTPVEDSVVEGFKGALVKASDLELRLRELASDAGLLKTQMHVSTYVSLLSAECIFCLPGCFDWFAMRALCDTPSGCVFRPSCAQLGRGILFCS